MEERDLSSLDLPDVPVGSTFDQRLTLMFDMIALAYQANLTRVFSFMMAAEASNQTYNHRHFRRVPSAVAPSERQGQKGKAGQDSGVSQPGLCQIPGQARGDAGRRRLDAGSFDPAVRQQYEQQQRP
jgi:hypothetical protein